MNALEMLQSKLGYTFSDPKILTLALTHSSRANESKTQGHNERLEFLGDAVLELHISQELYMRRPDDREGALTRMRADIVGETPLAALARRLDIGSCLLMGRGEASQGGRKRNALLADAVEAVIGAVHLDGGYEASRALVLRLFGDALDSAHFETPKKDHKSRLQEITQALFKELPVYFPLPAEGPDHAPLFKAKVELPNGAVFTASGTSIKKAEQNAAASAIAALEEGSK